MNLAKLVLCISLWIIPIGISYAVVNETSSVIHKSPEPQIIKARILGKEVQYYLSGTCLEVYLSDGNSYLAGQSGAEVAYLDKLTIDKVYTWEIIQPGRVKLRHDE